MNKTVYFDSSTKTYAIFQETYKPVPYLPPGIYTYGSADIFTPSRFQSKEYDRDSIIEKYLSPSHATLLNDILAFLNPETKVIYETAGRSYRRNYILYGKPGTGKTVSIEHLSATLQKNIKQTYAIYCKDVDDMQESMDTIVKVIEDINKPYIILMVIEEIDQFTEDNDNLNTLLSMLDGHQSKSNFMFIATTNNLDSLHDSIKARPSRFAQVLEYPELEGDALYKVIQGMLEDYKVTDNIDINWLTEQTEGFSFDFIKELFISTYTLKTDLKENLKRLRALKGLSECTHSRKPKAPTPDDDGWEEDDEEE